MNYEEVQKIEAATWCIDDHLERHEKAQRERCRYPMMAKQMGLHFIDTSNMEVWDIGGGPLGGVSSILPCRKRIVIDPLKDEYSKYFDVSYHEKTQAEDLKDRLSTPDLIIITNAIDHFKNPKSFLSDVVDYAKYGAFFATFHALNNAITHPHPAHKHNMNLELLHRYLDTDFETVWELKYPELRYGWVSYNGKVGQPAFAGLYRRVTKVKKKS